MSSWDYRVMRRKRKKGEPAGFGIYEVFYNEKGIIEFWTEDPIGHEYDSLKELKEDLSWQESAVSEPILNYDLLSKKAKARKKK